MGIICRPIGGLADIIPFAVATLTLLFPCGCHTSTPFDLLTDIPLRVSPCCAVPLLI